jgi:hypothetical protein
MSIPLTNQAPRIVSHDLINDTIIYPETTICKLEVRDDNDSIIDFKFEPNNINDYHAKDPKIEYLSGNVGLKQYLLYLSGNEFGRLHGTLHFCDEQGKCNRNEVDVAKIFRDKFDTEQLNAIFWNMRTLRDTSFLQHDWASRSLRIHFDADDESEQEKMTAGIISKFRITGDFSIQIQFSLRDDMCNGFEAGFFVSSKPDTSRWNPEKTGLFLAGNENNRIRLVARSVDLQHASQEIPFYAGRMEIRRSEENVSFKCHDVDPRSEPVEIGDGFSIDGLDTVYVQLNMRIEDRKRARHSNWDNFVIERGKVCW